MWNKPEGGRERELIASYCVYYSVQPMSTERRRLLRETESCIRKKRGDGYIEWKAEAEKKRLYSHHISINCCWQTGKKYKRSLPIYKESFSGLYCCWLLYIRVSLTLLDITKYQTIFFAWKLRGYVSNIYRRVSLLFHGRFETLKTTEMFFFFPLQKLVIITVIELFENNKNDVGITWWRWLL